MARNTPTHHASNPTINNPGVQASRVLSHRALHMVPSLDSGPKKKKEHVKERARKMLDKGRGRSGEEDGTIGGLGG